VFADRAQTALLANGAVSIVLPMPCATTSAASGAGPWEGRGVPMPDSRQLYFQIPVNGEAAASCCREERLRSCLASGRGAL